MTKLGMEALTPEDGGRGVVGGDRGESSIGRRAARRKRGARGETYDVPCEGRVADVILGRSTIWGIGPPLPPPVKHTSHSQCNGHSDSFCVNRIVFAMPSD